MRLYHSVTSPFVRKVMILLHETGLADRVELISARGSPLEPGTMPVDHNPLGKVPVLETVDGVLFDSRVICRYLDDLAQAGAYPRGADIWRTLTLEALADGIMDAAVLTVYEMRLRPEDMRFSPWVEAQATKITRALDALEADWIPHLTEVREGCPDMGAIAVGAALGYVDFRLGHLEWRADHPDLAAWEAGFSQRASMAASVPVG
ncbi:MAG: glutathione S-transferase [Paracoccaceae bacterium]